MKAIVYEEFQGQGSGRPNGLVWLAMKLDDNGKRLDCQSLDASSQQEAIAAAAELYGLPPGQVKADHSLASLLI